MCKAAFLTTHSQGIGQKLLTLQKITHNTHKKMKVLLVNTSERIGGAAIACNRLMKALKKNGVKAKMMVRDKQSDQLAVVSLPYSWVLPLRFIWERLVIFLSNGMSRKNLFQVDIANTGCDITQFREFKQADVIHLHWVNQAFLSLNDLERIVNSGKPVVITMHDQWYYTGVCHYAGDCTEYQTECTKCHLLGADIRKLANKVFLRKKHICDTGKNITFLGCSQWIADLARKGALTQGHNVVSIPNAIDTDVFHPSEKDASRLHLGLPANQKLLLFGSQRITDERKGFKYLSEACRILQEEAPEEADNIGIVVVGSASDKVANEVPLKVYPVSYVSDESQMVELYNAVDAFVTPSLQDNLPNTIVESMACGIPCIGFNIGGIPEMIDHKKNGYVARYKDAADLAAGIRWVLSSDLQQLSAEAREKALATYSEKAVAEKHIELYNSIM